MSATKVLIIDDEAHILQVLELKLRNAGYEVVTAQDGEEGYQAAAETMPDLIITDLQMPYLSGLDMCRKLAIEPSLCRIPVLMLTARGYALQESDLVGLNIAGVLAKPFSPRKLLNHVEEVLLAHQKREDAA